MKTIVVAAIFLLIRPAFAQHSPLYLNEFMASNMLATATADGEFVDWIEIYNSGSAPIDLAGCYLTDAPAGGNYWQFPAGYSSVTAIPAGGYKIFYADGSPSSGPDHIGFKLDATRGTIILLDAGNAAVLDSVSYGKQYRDISYGRTPSGSAQWGYMSRPTPNAANAAGFPDRASHPTIVQPAGIYSSVSVTIQPADPADIVRYTLDGSDPIETSPAYTLPVQITRTSIVKARSFRPGLLPSSITTKAFICETHTLPVLALMSDPKNLFDPSTGIWVNDGDGRTWERFGELDYIENGLLGIHVSTGLRIQGNTGPTQYQKRSFRAFMRAGYGDERLVYPLFKDCPVTSFTTLVLRSGYDDDLESGNTYTGTLIRDPLVERLWRRLGGIGAQDRFSILYINNESYGIYDIKESIGEDFIADHVGYKNIDLIRTRWDSTEVQAGDKVKWYQTVSFFATNTFTSDAKLAEAAQYIDIDNYMNLQVLVHATQFQSWAYGTFIFRNRTADGLWKITIWDEDRSLTDVNWNGFTTPYNPIAVFLDTLITRKLLQNPSYKTAFINRMADLLNTTLSTDSVGVILDSLKQSIEPEIPAEVARWGRTVADWNNHLNTVRDFVSRRPAVVRQQMQNYFGLAGQANLSLTVSGNGKILVNSVKVAGPAWTGVYFRGVPVTLTALPGPGYHFIGWQGASLTSDQSVTLTLSGNASLTALFGQNGGSNAELIAPGQIKAGRPLPVVVRIRDANGEINPVDQTPILIGFGGTHTDTTIAVKRGAGTGVVQFNGSSSFTLSVSSSTGTTAQKQVALSTAPVVSYSGTLPTGDITWNNSSDRLITADLTIPVGCHLTITEGTWILLKKYVNVTVLGELTVEGSSLLPVIIAPDIWSEPWGGFEFRHAPATFRYCMVLNGGGDLSKGYPTSEGWHTGHQHIFFGRDNSEFNFDHCFFLNSIGKVFGMQDGVATVRNSVSSFVWHGGEFHRVLLQYVKSHIMNVPDDNNATYTEDIDTDGLHIDYVNPLYPQYSLIDSCFFITGKDDAIDHHASRLKVSNCWLEEFVHEGVAASGGDTIRVLNTVALNNDQGFEAGNTDGSVNVGPFVYVDHCVAVGNRNGIRVGDSYTGTWYKDVMKVTNSIVYNNTDNIQNLLLGTQAPLPGALEVSYTMTNDADYNASAHCITGVPNFDSKYYLAPGSPGSGVGMRGSDMGRAEASVPAEGAVVINEIMYNAPAAMNSSDWIELYNPAQSAQDVSLWVLKDDDDLHSFTIPSGTTIPAKGYLVLCADTVKFRNVYPGALVIAGNISFGFGGNDQVRLFTAAGMCADSVAYQNTDPWPTSADGGGYSIVLKDPAQNHTLSSNWNRSGQFGGSPGRENILTDIDQDAQEKVPTEFALDQNYPNPFNLSTMIRFALPRESYVDLEILDLLGRKVAVLVSGQLAGGRYTVPWQADNLSSGVFFCRLRAGDFVSVKKILLLK